MSSGVDSMGHGARAPNFYKWLGTGGTVSRTTNKKLTKLYWSSRKRSPKRLIVLLEPKSDSARPKNFFPALRATSVPPLSNSFWRHCIGLRSRSSYIFDARILGCTWKYFPPWKPVVYTKRKNNRLSPVTNYNARFVKCVLNNPSSYNCTNNSYNQRKTNKIAANLIEINVTWNDVIQSERRIFIAAKEQSLRQTGRPHVWGSELQTV